MNLRHIAIFCALAPVVPAASCSDPTPAAECSALQSSVVITAYAGATQSDGSVTIYGTIQASNLDAGAAGAGGGGVTEITVRDVYVAGLEVQPASDAFNFRSWTVSLPADRLVAIADGAGQAHIPVVAYTYGGCMVSLPQAMEPVVTIPQADGGAIMDAGADG